MLVTEFDPPEFGDNRDHYVNLKPSISINHHLDLALSPFCLLYFCFNFFYYFWELENEHFSV